MAKKDTGYTFKDAEVSLEEGKIYEYESESILEHDLWEILKEIEANGRQGLKITSNKIIAGQQE